MDTTRQDEQAARLRKARIMRGFTNAKAAATRFGFNYTTYSQHERGHVGLTRAASDYARAFKVSEAWLLTGEGRPEDERMVPIVGLAGAGPDGTVLFSAGDGQLGEVPAPIDASPSMVALEVRGDSMRGTVNDGWLIFYDDPVAPSEEHMGELCVCFLEDGRVLVKIPYPGRERGLFNLESSAAQTLRDVPVRGFALVTDIKTRKAARKYVRQNPERQIPDVGSF